MNHHHPAPAIILPFAAAVLVALAALIACAAQPGSDQAALDAAAAPGKALATLALSATPPPTSTLPNQPYATDVPTLPLPTAVVLRQPTLPIGTPGPSPTPPFPDVAGLCSPPPMPFTPTWQNIQQIRALLRCPVGSPQSVHGVMQYYEHGLMFWRESDRSVFVLSTLAIQQGQMTDTWWRLDDTYQEGEPEADIGLAPPEGLLMPVRGFGKVWRNNGFIRDALGWATSAEFPADSQWQQFEDGWMMTGPDGSPVYALIPLDSPPYSTGLHFGGLP